jgi:O-antigen ligase
MKYLSSFMEFSQLNRLAFLVFLVSGAFTLLLWSPNVSGRFFTAHVKIIIYTLPWLLLWLVFHFEVITKKAYRLEIILLISIIILGIVNVISSDNPHKSAKAMEGFLLTGILAAWVSMFLIVNQARRDIFNWFCCGCFVIISTLEIIAFLALGISYTNQIKLFTLHPIPTGTLMILLSPGPAQLILSGSSRLKLLGYLAAIPGVVLVLLTGKRGTILALIAMALIWGLYRAVWLRYLVAGTLLTLALLLPFKGPVWFNYLNPQVYAHASILHRLELYPFALHVWKQHPVNGLGLRAFTQQNYLETYKQQNTRLTSFPREVKLLQTFDNMLVTSLVELGTLMTIAYLWLISLISAKYWRKLRSDPPFPRGEIYRILVLLGFAIHSMTYDSLVFPPVNWLFHVHLGIMAGYAVNPEPLPGVAASTPRRGNYDA